MFRVGESYVKVINVNNNLEFHTLKCLTKAFYNNKFWGLFEYKINNKMQGDKPLLKEIRTDENGEQYIIHKRNKITTGNVINDI